MPNQYIQESNYTYGAIRETSPAYGDEFLTDTFPNDQPSSGAWREIPIPPTVTHRKFTFCNTPTANKESLVVFIIEWPKKTDPFTQENLLYSEEVQVQELIFWNKTYLFIPYKERLANRLITLFKDAKEEDSACIGISASSLRCFYNFIQLHTNLKCPTISLTPEYNIYASWRDDQNRVFSVHFLPNGDVRFVIFKPNAMHPEQKIRICGTATADILKETVAPNGVWDWISE